MRVSLIVFATFFAPSFSLLSWASAAEMSLTPVQLRCEYLVDPLGMGETQPRLSWMLTSDRRSDAQRAYRVIVASSPEMLAKDQGDLWDSGRVESDESAHVVYAGKPLTSRMACCWKVGVWSVLTSDNAMVAPTWSRPAMWTMGLLQPGDWQAKWIESAGDSMAQASPIKIRRATYFATQGSVDVTARVAKLVKGNQLFIQVTNQSMGGDPSPQVKKKLLVEYELAGKNQTVTVEEDGTLAIPPETGRLPYLRHSFTAKSDLTRATLYVTALGLYEMHLNGRRVGNHVLAPDWTDYNKRVRYQAYDVTSLIKPGENALAGIIANGWYAGHIGNGGWHQYGYRPALLAQLELSYADGSTESVGTDGSWKRFDSPILSSDFMMGETCDARAEITGWAQPGFDDSRWSAVTVRDEPARPLDWQVSPPVCETGLIHPIALREPVPGHWVYDLGQNMVGVVRLNVSAPAGTKITLRHAEMLSPDGTIYTTNLRRAPSTDVYITNGTGTEIWQPKFTFHGFRYVELTGLAGKPAMDAVTGVVLGSDTLRTGSFSCSDPRVNQLMSNIQWGQRGNYLSVPTDCPQRDERLGWMGDAEVFVRTATDNADVAAFFTKWLVDVDDAQHSNGAFTNVSPERGSGNGTPAWGDAGVICPWTMYMAYSDTRILQRHLPAMTRWVEYCRAHSTGLLRDKDRGSDYGDWLSIKADTPKDVIGTAYFAYSTHLLAQAYQAVGDRDHAQKYQKLFQDIAAAFNKAYVGRDGQIQGNTQCCYAMALKFELLPEKLRPLAAQHLVEDIKARQMHLSTGFVGVSCLLPMLTQAGETGTAYSLLLQDTFPSWLFSVRQGATTIWERWDGWTPDRGFQDPSMNSFNHYSLGSCGEWLYDTVAGINWDPDHPGYKHIILRPTPGGGLTQARATIGSVYGPITSRWKLEDGRFSLDVSLPPNTTATLYLPPNAGDQVLESGKPVDQVEGVRLIRREKRTAVFELASGSYAFECR
jgi:alpha-L-rhamnosidase